MSPVKQYYCFLLFCRAAVLRFIERYDLNVALRVWKLGDIPKWRSQKAVWVPFFVSLDVSVWTTLQEVLTADAAKQLFFKSHLFMTSLTHLF